MLDDKSINAIAALAARHREAIPTPDGGSAILVPDGYDLKTIPPLDVPLTRIRQSLVFHDLPSFTSYVNTFTQSERTRIFAEPGFLAGGQAKVTAVLDYHTPDHPDHGTHIATYSPRYSDQWQLWKRVCGPEHKQAAFAELIEEARADIRAPEAANLLDIVRTFKANKKTEFDSVVYQPNGSVLLNYSEQVAQTGTSGALPETMTLGIPVYFRGTIYAVPLFVRYRVGNGGVAFQLKLDRADVIEDAAFSEVAKIIFEVTGIEVYMGRRS